MGATRSQRPEPIGLYLSLGESPEDAIIVFGAPADDIPKLVHGGCFRTKPVAPGIDIEKVASRLAGLRIYPKPDFISLPGFEQVGKREHAELTRLVARLRPTMSVILQRLEQILGGNGKVRHGRVNSKP